MKRIYANHGFSLLEIMVAVLILAIGLLGIAGLQAVAKRTNYEAMQRTSASMLAQEMIERIRANPGELNTYITDGANIVVPLTGSSFTGTPPDCNNNDCTPAQLAAYDLFQWEQAIAGATELRAGDPDQRAGGLVSPVACISQPTGAASGTVRVAIAWRGMTALSNPTLDACGEDGTGGTRFSDNPGDNAYRRVLMLNSFLMQ